jgi:hypothetical protein
VSVHGNSSMARSCDTPTTERNYNISAMKIGYTSRHITNAPGRGPPSAAVKPILAIKEVIQAGARSKVSRGPEDSRSRAIETGVPATIPSSAMRRRPHHITRSHAPNGSWRRSCEVDKRLRVGKASRAKDHSQRPVPTHRAHIHHITMQQAARSSNRECNSTY